MHNYVYNQLYIISGYISDRLKHIQRNRCSFDKNDNCEVKNKILDFKSNKSIITELARKSYNDEDRKKIFMDFIESIRLELNRESDLVREKALNEISIVQEVYELKKQYLIEWLQ
jgi:hypothetical protein